VVRISAHQHPDGAIDLTVADTGIGMTAAELEKVVEPFAQVDNVLSRRHSGTGLGLPLALKFMEAHGGSLSLESSPGMGTIAVAHIPYGVIKELPDQPGAGHQGVKTASTGPGPANFGYQIRCDIFGIDISLDKAQCCSATEMLRRPCWAFPP
jgi:hypothetical protein